jgi:hypothetical protein
VACLADKWVQSYIHSLNYNYDRMLEEATGVKRTALSDAEKWAKILNEAENVFMRLCIIDGEDDTITKAALVKAMNGTDAGLFQKIDHDGQGLVSSDIVLGWGCCWGHSTLGGALSP